MVQSTSLFRAIAQTINPLPSVARWYGLQARHRPATLTVLTMSWKKSKFASSLLSLFVEAAPDLSPESRVKDIRQAMLDSLAVVGESQQITRVWARILYAPDIQALWYLRADLMTLLAGLLGESAAHARLATISDMFSGLLPAAQKSRPNRLRK